MREVYIEKETYYKGRIRELLQANLKLKDELANMTRINILFKHQMHGLEELYFSDSRERFYEHYKYDPTFKDIMAWATKKLKGLKSKNTKRRTITNISA